MISSIDNMQHRPILFSTRPSKRILIENILYVDLKWYGIYSPLLLIQHNFHGGGDQVVYFSIYYVHFRPPPHTCLIVRIKVFEDHNVTYHKHIIKFTHIAGVSSPWSRSQDIFMAPSKFCVICVVIVFERPLAGIFIKHFCYRGWGLGGRGVMTWLRCKNMYHCR